MVGLKGYELTVFFNMIKVNKKNLPLVTIGVPSFERPVSLKKTLESICNQSYSNIEVLVSDNCSKNLEITKVLRDYSLYSNIKIIIQPNNIGAHNNFQYLLNNAIGEFFMFLADDDFLDPNYVKECVHFLNTHPDFVAAGGSGIYYSDTGKERFREIVHSIEGENVLQRLLSYYVDVGINSQFYSIYRTAIAKSIKIPNQLGGDWLYFGALLISGKYGVVKNQYIHRRIDGSSVSTESLNALYGRTDINPYNVNSLIASDCSNFFAELNAGSRNYKLYGDFVASVIELKGNSKYGV